MAIDLTVNDTPVVPLSVESGNGIDFQHSEAYIYAISPSAKVEESEDGATITIKDKDGETVVVLHNGRDGATGPKGDTGERGPQGPKGDTGATGPAGSDADVIRFLPIDSVSGAVASFPDGADGIHLKSLVVDIDPVQDTSSGDPSSENICPISGWTGMNLSHISKNLFNEQEYFEKAGFTLQDNGYYEGNFQRFASNVNGFYVFDKPMPLGVVTVSFDKLASSSLRLYFHYQGNDESTWQNRSGNLPDAGHYVYTSDKTKICDGVRFYTIAGASARLKIKDIQITCGANDYGHEHRVYESISVSWEGIAGTVYGGSLDVLTGVLTVTHYGIDGGNVNWIKTDSYAYGKFHVNTSPLAAYSVNTPTVISSAYKSAANSFASADGNYVWIRSNSATIRQLRVKDDAKDGMTAEEFKVAMAGVQFVYELADPITYQLTPHEVRSLLGANIIYADTGDTSVEYRADIQRYIDKKLSQ